MPTILGGLHEIRATETASLEVLVSPPLLGSAGWAAVVVTVFQRHHLGLGPRWKPLLIDHQLLHSPHEGCGAGPGHQNRSLSSEHGARP
jgi:hypothetical protein